VQSTPRLTARHPRRTGPADGHRRAPHHRSNNGVKDIDVYTFYARYAGVMIHPLRHGLADFYAAGLGYRPADTPYKGKPYVGRRVDFLQRALNVSPDADPVEAVSDWLRSTGDSP